MTPPTRLSRLLLLILVLTGLLGLPVIPASAHPEGCGKEEGGHDEVECLSDEEIAGFDDSNTQLQPGETASENMRLVSNLPKSGPFAGESAFGSDLAFWGKYAFQGNYNGFQITDVSDPGSPRIVSQVTCPGAQNDISVWRNLVVTSTDSRRNDDSCNSFALGPTTTPSSTDPEAEYWEGLKVFDWSDPADPRLVTTVETDCGSHTHTILPEQDRVLVYVSSYDLNRNAKDCRLTDTPEDDHDKISIVEIPLDRPQDASVIAEPVLFPDGGNPGNGYTRQTRGCHDITVYQAIGLAAGACMGQGSIIDISDPEQPTVMSNVYDDDFAFWHSATFSNDGETAVFTDELGGGGGPTCNPTVGPDRGANGIYDISDPAAPVFASHYKIPRTNSNTENCVAHNGSLIPAGGRDVMVQAWYQGGTSVFDFTDPYNPKEIAWFDRGPLSNERRILGGSWSSYWYNGKVFSNDIQQGLDVFTLTGADRALGGRVRLPFQNVQSQMPLP